MSKPKIESLSEIDIKQLEELSQIRRYYLRTKIILFSNLGFEPKEVAVLLNCNIWTVWKRRSNWKKSKFAGLNIEFDEKAATPDVLQWQNRILEVVNTPPRELKQPFATWSIARLWYFMRQEGCPFGHNRVREIMKLGGLRFRSTKLRPFAVHPDYALRKAKVFKAYLDMDEDHLVLVLDQKIFLSDVGVKGRQWSTSIPSIPSYQWHNGKAIMLGVYDVKRDKIYHAWMSDLKGQSIRDAFRAIFRLLPTHKRCTIIMDNYQGNRAKIFQKDLKRKGIKVCWLPAWSPHLSLIESKFSLVKAEAIISIIISSVRALKMHVTRWIKYYNGIRKNLYPKPKYALG